MKKKILLVLSILTTCGAVLAQTITGVVSDAEDGSTLPGVTVAVKGTTVGTVTSIDGEYTIQASSSDVLQFRFLGYHTIEVKVENQSEINVALPINIQQLEQVVVIGYGTQKEKDLTGAVGSIRGDDIISKPFSSPDQALSGMVAGVNIINRSGDAAAPINVRIRGVGTFGVNKPLWVIDGVPIVQTENNTVNTSSTTDSNPLAGINPNDIESIDVLKDASAAAIYGSRAANGVIIVTTKRGKNGKASISYDGYFGVAEVRDQYEVLNVDQYIDIQSELGRDFSSFRGSEFVDWQDAAFQNGSSLNHNLSVSGGNENANYFVSGSYFKQEGIERPLGFERYSIKANSDIKAGEKFKFGESITLSRSERVVGSEGGGIYPAFNGALNSPFYQIYDDSQIHGYNLETPDNFGNGGVGQNVIWRTDRNVNDTKIVATKVLVNVYGEFEILKDLKFRMSEGIDYNVGDNYFFQNDVNYGSTTQQSLLVQSRPIELTTNWTNTLTYNKSFGEHDLSFMLGYEETTYRFDKTRIQGRNLLAPDAVKFASTGTAIAAGNEADQWALRGTLGRVNYNYKGKYLATVNIRRDESSRFSKENRAQTFLSGSLGWRLSEESFFPKDGVIDDLKIRAGWGQNGNQFTGVNLAYQSALQTTIFYVDGNGNVIRTPAPVNFANKDLKWETSSQIDIGVDASLFDNKVDITIDYYNKTTSDVLVGLPLPYVSGYFLPSDANIGEINNRGIEMALGYRNSVGDFTYSISGNFTTTKNEVISLGEIPEIISGNGGAQTHRTAVGESIGYFYGYKTDGIYQNQAEADAALPDNVAGGQPEAGDIRFVDVNGDGVIDSNDRTNIGSPIPGFFYGAMFQCAYKGFDFSLQLQGIGNRQVYNVARSRLEDMRGGDNMSASVLGRWTGEGTSNSMPRATEADPNNNNRFSDRWVEDADFLRIKNLQIGYNFSNSFLQKTTSGNVTDMRVFLGFQNLATFTKYSGYDPEVTRNQSFQKGENALATGEDGGASPLPRIIQVGWSIKF